MRDCRGFSMVEIVIILAVIGILSSMAFLGIRSTRAAMRLNNSARNFAQNVERARLDAIRRHGAANVEFVSPTSYQITMDFANTGTLPLPTRQFDLDSGVSLVLATGAAYPYADFDWRGRTSQCSMLFTLQDDRGDQGTVQVAGSGDVTVNNAITTTANINYTSVVANSNVVSTATVTGTDPKLNVTPCGASGGTVVPIPVGTCGGSSWGPNVGYITIRRNGGSTSSVVVTVHTAGTVTATPDANLSATPASQSIGPSSGGSATFSIASTTKTRGTFPVKFYFTCSSTSTPQTVYVQVTN